MKEKTQIELAEKMVDYLNDYIVLAKIEKKLKVENVEEQLNNVTDFIHENVEVL